jgi:hypothetical protein
MRVRLEVIGCALLISGGVAGGQVSGTVPSVDGTPLAGAIAVGRVFETLRPKRLDDTTFLRRAILLFSTLKVTKRP